MAASSCSPRLAPVGTGGLLTRSFDNYSQSTVVRSETQMTAERPLMTSSTPVPKKESSRSSTSHTNEQPQSRWQIIEPEGYTSSSAKSYTESRQTVATSANRNEVRYASPRRSASAREERVAPRSTGIPKATESSVAALDNVTFVTQAPTASTATITEASSTPRYASTASTKTETPLSRREQRALDKQRRAEAKRLLAERERETASAATAMERNAIPVRATQPQAPVSVAVPAATIPKPDLSATVAQAVTMPEANVTSTQKPTFTQSERTVTVASEPAAVPPTHNFKPNETEHVKFSYYDPFGEGNNRFLVVLGEQRFCYPYPGKFLSGYGPRGRSVHTGVDIKGVKNDTIRAAFAGTVRMSKPYSGYGNCVVIRHKNGLETLYAHNSRNLVRVGDVVQAGDPIALIGRTGRATTEHCHFEVRIQGQHINPALILDVNNHTLRAGVLSVTKQSNGRIVAVNRASGLAPSQATDVEDSSPSTVATGGGETRMASTSSSKTSSAKSSSATTTYTVKSGDSLWSIARRFGTTVNALCTLNHIEREATLPLGKRLRIR